MRFDLLRYDLRYGFPAAVQTLRRHLRRGEFLRFLGAFVRRNLRDDPFAGLGPPANPGDAFTRHQLAPVLHMDAVLQQDLGLPAARVQEILAAVVGETGATFLGFMFRGVTAGGWRAMSAGDRDQLTRGLLAKFENAEGEVRETGADQLAFDVTFCHFAALTQRLGRPDLAPLFCHADSVFFGRPESPVRLERTETIARGDRRCGFRLRLRDDAE